jgi:hypothetical protein
MNRTFILIAGVVAAAVAGIAGWYAWQQAPQPVSPGVAVPASQSAAATSAPPAIQHPIEDAALANQPAAEAVPLDHSDAAMREALANVFADHALPPFLHVDRIVRNIVATVDALPRDRVSPTVMPVNPASGHMIVGGDASATTIAADNAARYTPYIDVLKTVDDKVAAGIYLKYYPLFQQAYRELGYPNGYFNDRLVAVIDLLLATPDVEGPFKLDQPKVVYVYADPALEALPAGQKILLRIGRDNAAVVKAKLREFRGYIVRTPPAK